MTPGRYTVLDVSSLGLVPHSAEEIALTSSSGVLAWIVATGEPLGLAHQVRSLVTTQPEADASGNRPVASLAARPRGTGPVQAGLGRTGPRTARPGRPSARATESALRWLLPPSARSTRTRR